MKLTDIPLEWHSALGVIREFAPDAVIAGGALRDLDNGREVKDIDVFSCGEGAPWLNELHRRMTDAGIRCEPIDDKNMYPVGELNDLVGFFDFYLDFESLPFQMIVTNHPTDTICERFDFGICRLAFDGRTVTQPPEYDEDKEAQLFRLRRHREPIELVASIHRYARLTKKYEDWRFALQPEEPIDWFTSVSCQSQL